MINKTEDRFDKIMSKLFKITAPISLATAIVVIPYSCYKSVKNTGRNSELNYYLGNSLTNYPQINSR